ncbi:MAG: hypothetical protein LBG94_06595 [Treponema sp.]|jgi:TolA-binding protein|nr:hypothetical protein [Treponema sp.]
MKNNYTIIFLILVFMLFSNAGINASDDDQIAAENEELNINDKPLEVGINKLRNDNSGDYNDELAMKIQQLEKRIEELVKINDELGYRTAELRIENYAWITEMVQLINANDQLRDRVDELEKLSSDITDLIISSEELRNTSYELLNVNIELTHNNGLLRDRIIELEAGNNELRSTVEELRTENERLRAENEELKIRLDELRRLADSLSQTPPVLEAAPVQITDKQEQQQPPLAEETPPALPSRPDYPSGPPARVDSILQAGMIPQESEIIFSRIVRATVGQILEIPFRGNGWVYLGELASRRGIDYSSRRNDTDGQSFIFALEEAGTYVLKFYRQDFIRNFIFNDHVQVIVGEVPAAVTGWFNPSYDRGRVVAQPRWPSAIEEAQLISGTRPSSEPVVSGAFFIPGAGNNGQGASSAPISQSSAVAAQSAPPQSSAAPTQTTPSQTTASSSTQGAFSADPFPGGTQVYSPQAADSQLNDFPVTNETVPPPPLIPADVLLQSARESFDRGNIASALTTLAQYMDSYPAGSDEALWLLGQSFEANSPNRDILRSLDNYRRLTNEYPQSDRFEDARRRISYLERFYITIQ